MEDIKGYAIDLVGRLGAAKTTISYHLRRRRAERAKTYLILPKTTSRGAREHFYLILPKTTSRRARVDFEIHRKFDVKINTALRLFYFMRKLTP